MPDRLILDVTKTFQSQFATGIQRVVRELLRRRDRIGGRLDIQAIVVVASKDGYRRLSDTDVDQLLKPTPRTAAVLTQSRMALQLKRLMGLNLAFYAMIQRRVIARQMARLTEHFEPIDVGAGDIVVLADYIGAGSTSVCALLRAAQTADATIAVVYDIIGFTHPDMVPATTIYPFRWAFERLVPVVDGLVTIARSTADDIRANPLVRRYRVPVASFHLGHDLRVDGHFATISIPATAWTDGPTFVMIGTIEPRKRHAAVLDAFERLWAKGVHANLLMIGSKGWDVNDLLERVHRHPRSGQSLFLCHQVGDHEMRDALQRADAMIIASKAEGFGLPIVEALAIDTPVLASDIPVFREIAGEAGCYFPPDDTGRTADVIENFIRAPEGYRAAARAFRWIDWDAAADQFADALRAIPRKPGRS